MKRRLFLTGPIGCGKSTAIREGLGSRMGGCRGFLTRRYREPGLRFTLESPDGAVQATFLDFPTGKPAVQLDVFGGLGVALLNQTGHENGVWVLDEIGGVELLNPAFTRALDALLDSDVPIVGVLKGEGPAGKLVQSLNLTEEYETAAQALRQRLRNDSDTLVYECTQFDEQALLLVRQWAEEYCHD